MLYAIMKDPEVTDLRLLYHLWRMGLVSDWHWWSIVKEVHDDGNWWATELTTTQRWEFFKTPSTTWSKT